MSLVFLLFGSLWIFPVGQQLEKSKRMHIFMCMMHMKMCILFNEPVHRREIDYKTIIIYPKEYM